MKAAYFKLLDDKNVRCILCPHKCLLKPGETGKCRVRHNVDGVLETEVFNNISAMAVDPIEKKPLYHFYPGTDIVSIGSFGCNMKCPFCQNHEISQPSVSVMNRRKNEISASAILSEAKRIDTNIGLAFTYNEPIVWYEFMMDLATRAKKAGIATVMVSNGYISSEPLKGLIEFIDAFNIDLKAFNNDFYRKYTGAAIKPVLNTLKDIVTSGRHLEITYLIIPGYNDNQDEFRDCILWIVDNLGPDVILHLSRYFPNYQFTAPPTPSQTVVELYNIAKDKINFVYPGNINIPGIMDTLCPDCGLTITSRSGYFIKHLNTEDGNCSQCERIIYRYFRH